MHTDVKPIRLLGPALLVVGFMAGISAGAILGVLFAPKKGEETRRELKEKAMAARKRVQDRMAAQKDKLKNSASQAAESAENSLPR